MTSDYTAKVEKLRQQQERARVRRLEKLNSPEYRESVNTSARKAAERSALKRKEKLADPAYRKMQVDKQKAAAARRVEKSQAKPDKKPPAKRKAIATNRERSKTVNERKLWDELGQLPCVACLLHGKEKHPVSIHHMRGRTTEHCHRFVIPLCEWHHDTPAPAEVRDKFSWLVPRHAKGSVGGKPAFEKANAKETELMLSAYQMIGRHDEARELLAL